MKVGVGLPYRMPTDSWGYISELARRADEGPYSSFAALDRLAYDNFEAMAELAAVAAITKRLRLVTGILLAPLRNAGVLAKQAATIDAISNGRLTLGLAVGGREDDAIVAPAQFRNRGRLFEEQLVHMKRIWAGEVFEGAQHPVGPAPVQPGGPEILIGGTHPRAIARIGKFASGYVMGTRSLEAEWVRNTMAQIDESWVEHEREGKPRIVVTLPCALGPGADDAVAAALGHYYGGDPSRQARLQPTTPEVIRNTIAMHEELGSDEVIFRPVTPDLEQLERLTDAIG
ncbi:MAG: LLM class flavin-dependent oxidoreductase [Chloroflexota bacterium]|nr:LLM class flavin-dependent oxidoreductase [Chloroflexota bacterium]MDE2886202.1 LLM class flavin-dependent oxidoreductase [Chloroflexota bacterium]